MTDNLDTLTLTIPRNEWMSSNGRQPHWAEVNERRRALHARTIVEARRQHIAPRTSPTVVWILVGYPTRAAADPANAYPTVKPVIDGLVHAGIFTDDNSDLVTVGFDRDPARAPKGTHTLTLVFHDRDTFYQRLEMEVTRD